MLAEFKEMPRSARVWVYQADRELTEKETEMVKERTAAFVSSWDSHGHPVKAAFNIAYNRFLILAVDESFHQASGCSIDKSVQLLRELEEGLQISFLDRSIVAFKKGEKIFTAKLPEIKKLIQDNLITPDTHLFNNSVSDFASLEKDWIVPVRNSWASRFLV